MHAHSSDAGLSRRLIHLPLTDPATPIAPGSIGVCVGRPPEFVLGEAVDRGIAHVVQRDGVAFATEVATADLIIRDPHQFLHEPLSAILTPARSADRDVMIWEQPCSSFEERARVGALAARAVEKAVNSHLAVEVRMAIDELATNALRHGPGRVPQLVRPCMLSMGRDRERLILACRDPYGTLNPRDVAERLRKCFIYGMAPMINFGVGGAGLGLYMLYRTAIAFYAASSPGKGSTVCLSLPLRGSHTKREAMPKNIHLNGGVKL